MPSFFSFARLLKTAALVFATTAAFMVPSAMAGFPAGKCVEHSCAATPYKLRWTNPGGENGLMCFQVDWDETCRSDYGCCDLFAQRFNKVVLASPPECKSAMKFVTLNGVAKGGGVYFDLYENDTRGELRITNLNMNSNSAVGTTFCIKATGRCGSAATFCDDGRGQCRYAVYDVVRHECCPTCAMPILQTPILQTPTAPPPRTAAPVPRLSPPPLSRPPPPQSPSTPLQPTATKKGTLTCECVCEDPPSI